MRVKAGSRLGAPLVAALVFTACGDGGAEPAPRWMDDGGFELPMDAGRDGGRDAGDAASDGSTDGGGTGEGGADAAMDAAADGGSTENGPTVQVLAPLPAADSTSANVLVGPTVKVRCSAVQSEKSALVDPASIKVALLDARTNREVVSQKASSTPESGVYEGELVLKDAPHGPVRIQCQAADLATKPGVTITSVDTLFDQGPLITFTNPTQSFVAKGAGDGEDVRVVMQVVPRPLDANDPNADVEDVDVTIGGRPFDAVQRSSTEPTVYSFGLDFSDTTLFTVVPDTLSVRVNAITKRRSASNPSTATLSVGVDGEGPQIVVKAPAMVNGHIPVVSGKVEVALEITDKLAGVDGNSVVVRIPKFSGSGNDEYRASSGGAVNAYLSTFETGTYPGKPILQLTIEARDKVGNITSRGYPVDVDTVAPWISLEPPTVRERNLANNIWQCSAAFDPVGDDAVNAGIVPNTELIYRPRVLIWDRPLPGGSSSRYAMINNTTTRLYVQHNRGAPLLVDADGDSSHYCDDIVETPANVELEPVVVTLSPVTPAGAPHPAGYWRQDSSTQVTFVPDWSGEPAAACDASIPASFGSPKRLADDTVMTRVIKHSASGTHPVVYANSPTTSGNRSTGTDYVGPEGWACLIATATDNAGNFAFSEPMLVCTEKVAGACLAAQAAGEVPACTDGCVIPDHFKRSPSGATGPMPRVITYASN